MGLVFTPVDQGDRQLAGSGAAVAAAERISQDYVSQLVRIPVSAFQLVRIAIIVPAGAGLLAGNALTCVTESCVFGPSS
jgi:hypothetical protein